jgi:hypothetical protein
MLFFYLFLLLLLQISMTKHTKKINGECSGTASQMDIFSEVGPLIQSALDGYHVCIFAYGQTGSGKTYTMDGELNISRELAGVIPRSVEKIFACTEQLRREKGWTFALECSYLEIYQDEIRDLLGDGDHLPIKHAKDGRPVVRRCFFFFSLATNSLFFFFCLFPFSVTNRKFLF